MDRTGPLIEGVQAIMIHRSDSGQRMMLELRAREAWMQRNYPGTQELAEQWAALSLAEGDDESWWNASYLTAEALRKQGRMSDSYNVAEDLALHPLTQRSAALRARVDTLRAFALQGSGDLTTAVLAARGAIAEVEGLAGHNGIAILAQNALIAALAESGQLEEAWQACLTLAHLLHEDPANTYAGQSYWAIGNVAFLLKQISDGVAFHERAANTLSPINDLDLWARFNHGSAQTRLAAGLIEPETLECIERAEMAMSIAGGTPRDRLELDLTRAHWLVLSGQPEEAIERLRRIVAGQDLLALHTAAQAHFLLGQALTGSDSASDAVAHLALSEQLFMQSGAEDRAGVARALIIGIEQP
jgi:tetratricopeptide (TPR) repeat protein